MTVPLRSSRQWVREQAAFLVVVAILVAAFCYLAAAPAHPIRAALGIAAGALVAAVLRLVLPVANAGLLAVRGRVFDVIAYLVLGGLIVLACIRLKQ